MMEDQFYDQQTLVSKGKRTKRQRPMSPLVLTMATTTSSSCSSGGGGGGDGGFCDLNLSCGGGGGGGGSGGGGDHFIASPSTNSSSELLQSKVDEEDMANCLILLAQGRRHHPEFFAGINDAKTISPDGGDVYECKTCNRRFHSFQALGGHRASHRKPKLLALSEYHKKQPENNSQQLHHKFNNNTSVLSLQVSRGKDSCNNNNNNNNKTRVHECLICGAEFSSGQALGGHMRRHRPLPVAGAGAGASSSTTHDDSTQEVIKKSRLEVLGLDLNLPAPAEDDQHPRGSVFTFASKDQVPVFATSQLVHCHY